MYIPEDKILIERIKQGDYSAFNCLFYHYYGRLCSYAYRIILDRQSAEDIVQDLFVKFWEHRHDIEVSGNLFGYLLKSVKNASINFLRAERTKETSLENYPFTDRQTERDFLEEQEFLFVLEGCINELPERSRQVFRMSRIDGQKHHEIAVQLGISVKTIKNQIWKSLQYLRSCLIQKSAL